jgi:hypothetical protein
MARSVRLEVGRWSAMLWLAITTIYLLIVSVLICGNAGFQLKLGAIRTTGPTGLWMTLAPAILGCCAFFLVAFRARAGAIALGVYCGFWMAVLAGTLPWVWNAHQSFCMRTMCIRTPWIGRLLVFALMTPFAIVAIWARHEFARLRRSALPGQPSASAR